MKWLKYLSVFTLPLTVSVSFQSTGVLSFLPVLVFFVLVPVAELVLPEKWHSNEATEQQLTAKSWIYSGLLYLLVLVQWSYVGYFLNMHTHSPDATTWWGRAISMGIMCGVIGINVGHELGHRTNKWDQLMGELLFLSSLENHFIPYHNRGHHTNVGTRQDPATARKNELIFLFWFRSQIGSYIQAWQIEKERMQIMKKPFVSFSNKMIAYTLIHAALLTLIYFWFGPLELVSFITVAAIGILLLETVNYIEHYGLVRRLNENGRYESVKRKHSWNSNHMLGRVILFELSRHSEHHYKADKPYQLLHADPTAPTMPTGYPGMMLLSFVPPLFFKIMNPRVKRALES